MFPQIHILKKKKIYKLKRNSIYQCVGLDLDECDSKHFNFFSSVIIYMYGVVCSERVLYLKKF